MKKQSVRVCAALALSVALIIVACTITPTHGPGVSIHETYVEIYPGTKISSKDQNALDAVLKQFNKSLYRIGTYDQGKLVKTRGSLEDTLIPQRLVAEVTKASQKGVSDLALEIGRVCAIVYTSKNPVPVSPPPPPPMVPPSQQELRDSVRLVNKLRPILLKYSHDQVANVVKSGGQ